MKNYSVLFIEDDKMDEAAIHRSLDQDNSPYVYEVATSVKDAKARLTYKRYDVAVVDFMLSDGTCFDVLNLLGDTPFIILTGEGSEYIAVEAMKCGAADYVIKDHERTYLSSLPATIESAIQRKPKGE